MRGRKPLPPELHILRGNPGKRPLPEGVPKPATCAPDPPADLSPAARGEWEHVVPELMALGVLGRIDRRFLIAYVNACADYDEARRKLAEFGPIVKEKLKGEETGRLIPSPYRALERAALQTIRSFGSEFGLSAASRVRLGARGQSGEDELDTGWAGETA